MPEDELARAKNLESGKWYVHRTPVTHMDGNKTVITSVAIGVGYDTEEDANHRMNELRARHEGVQFSVHQHK